MSWFFGGPVWRIAALIAAIMMLYPPWSVEIGNEEVVTAGYSFLWEPPEEYLQVDTTRLFLQLLALFCIAGALGGVSNAKNRHKYASDYSQHHETDQKAITGKDS